MRILFHANDMDAAAWSAELGQALPGAEVRVWREGDDAGADYAVVWKPSPAMLQACRGLARPGATRPALKALFNLGAGADAILKYGSALPENVPIIRLDDAGMAVQMAEYATHAVLRYFRRFDEYEAQARSGRWQALAPREKQDFPVGILGMGVLGSRIADALMHFGFPVRGWSRTRKNVQGVQSFAGRDELDAFLQGLRTLICALPLTHETRGILDRGRLACLPRGAYLVNVARGAHVVEADLLELVRQGHIAGAMLDVFEEEPLPAGHPFWREPGITVTPHVAALTLRGDSVRQIAGKIRALERGEPVAGVIDRSRGY